jgi:hypothetical protein
MVTREHHQDSSSKLHQVCQKYGIDPAAFSSGDGSDPRDWSLEGDQIGGPNHRHGARVPIGSRVQFHGFYGVVIGGTDQLCIAIDEDGYQHAERWGVILVSCAGLADPSEKPGPAGHQQPAEASQPTGTGFPDGARRPGESVESAQQRMAVADEPAADGADPYYKIATRLEDIRDQLRREISAIGRQISDDSVELEYLGQAKSRLDESIGEAVSAMHDLSNTYRLNWVARTR